MKGHLSPRVHLPRVGITCGGGGGGGGEGREREKKKNHIGVCESDLTKAIIESAALLG